MSLFDCAYALAWVSELQKQTRVTFEITRQQRTGFLSGSIQRAGNGWYGPPGSQLDQLRAVRWTPPPDTSTAAHSPGFLWLQVFNARRGGADAAALMQRPPESLVEVEQKPRLLSLGRQRTSYLKSHVILKRANLFLAY